MSKSIRRVQSAASQAGLAIDIKRMGGSTRTAEEAAEQCGCSVAQIVKSLIFEGQDSARLYLFLISGSHQLDLNKAARMAGEPLKRADPQRIRDETGFAIGGVSPLGQPEGVRRFGDKALLGFNVVWAAAGAHDAVFAAEPNALFSAANVIQADLAA